MERRHDLTSMARWGVCQPGSLTAQAGKTLERRSVTMHVSMVPPKFGGGQSGKDLGAGEKHMSRTWLSSMVLAALVVAAGTALEAQRTSRVIDTNTYGDKFSTGGFGVAVWTALQIDGDLYRGTPVPTDTPGVSALGRGVDVKRDEGVTGIGLNWQFGSSSEVMGVNAFIHINNYTIDTVAPTSAVTGLPGAGVTSFSSTVSKFGFNIIWNPIKSLERSTIDRGDPLFDASKTERFGFSAFFGPNLSFLSGDLNDLNGVAALGFDFGVLFDIPLGDANEFNLAPSFWFETNYHFSGDAQRSIFNSTETRPTGVGQNNGVVVRSHTLVPSFAWNLGADFVWRPRFGDNQENNHWRFAAGAYLNVPFAFNNFFAEDPGDAYKTDGDGSTYLTIALSFAYVW